MGNAREIVRMSLAGTCEVWAATKLDQLGISEQTLEEVLSAHPSLLGLESVQTQGVQGSDDLGPR